MKQGQVLTSEEIEIVNTLIWRKPVREVAEKIGKSLLTLHYYLKHRDEYPPEKDKQKLLSMGNDQNQQLLQQPKCQQKQQQHQHQQQKQQRINQTTTTVRNKYVKKLKIEVMLTQNNRQERLNFATQYVEWDEDIWKRVIFHDERKFNLDGPDGFTHYFHDMRNNERILSNRPRGEAVYVWFAISSMGAVLCKVSSTKFTKEIHLELLDEVTKSIGNTKPYIMQQQQSCSLNNEILVQNWIQENKIETQMWPNISHDINIMENIWGWLIREVYDGGKQFSRKVDLLYKIQDVWATVPIYLIQNLYSSLPNRMIELFYTKGQYTNCS